MTFRIDPARYDAAPSFGAYVDGVGKHAELWLGLSRTAIVPAEAVEQLRGLAGGARFLVLSEDWCSDCFSIVPTVARLAEGAGMDLRVLARDANPDIMDEHLSSGTRSIPVVMVLDEEFRVPAWWGPRPTPLQRWYRSEGLLLPGPERSRKKRAWYARDRGKTVVWEIVETVARAARRHIAP